MTVAGVFQGICAVGITAVAVIVLVVVVQKVRERMAARAAVRRVRMRVMAQARTESLIDCADGLARLRAELHLPAQRTGGGR